MMHRIKNGHSSIPPTFFPEAPEEKRFVRSKVGGNVEDQIHPHFNSQVRKRSFVMRWQKEWNMSSIDYRQTKSEPRFLAHLDQIIIPKIWPDLEPFLEPKRLKIGKCRPAQANRDEPKDDVITHVTL